MLNEAKSDYCNSNPQRTALGPRINGSSSRLIGEILADCGKLSASDQTKVLEYQRKKGLQFGEAAVKRGLVKREDVWRALSIQYGFPYIVPGETSYSAELVVACTPFSRRAEAIRNFRSQLMLQWYQGGNKSLALVSPFRREGRSYVAANLAVAFAQLGCRTLLIDADFRFPRQHTLFNLPNRIGLGQLILGKWKKSSIHVVHQLGQLCVLVAGPVPPNPIELLGSNAFSDILAQARDRFDVVVIDTPAGISYSDGENVAARADNAIVVTRRYHTRFRATESFVTRLLNSGAKPIGSILNCF